MVVLKMYIYLRCVGKISRSDSQKLWQQLKDITNALNVLPDRCGLEHDEKSYTASLMQKEDWMVREIHNFTSWRVFKQHAKIV